MVTTPEPIAPPAVLEEIEREKKPWRFDLFARFPWLKRLVKMRSFQFLLILPNLVFFYFFLITGLFGTPVGNRNIIIIFVWILWWVLLIALLVARFFMRPEGMAQSPISNRVCAGTRLIRAPLPPRLNRLMPFAEAISPPFRSTRSRKRSIKPSAARKWPSPPRGLIRMDVL